MDTALLSQLASPQGQTLMEAIANLNTKDSLALSRALRKQGFAAELVAAALTQNRLRTQAEAKLGPFAERMFFTQAGLEQATRLPVAAHHARRFLGAGVTTLADLTSGIGADSMAFAALGLNVVASEIDPLTAAIAAENLAPFPNAQVVNRDGLTTDFVGENIDGVYADPARRDGAGKRIFDPQSYLPALDDVWNLRSQVSAVGIKVGPGIPHDALPAECETQWVSLDGDVVEAGLWFGSVAHFHGRSALVLTTTAQGQQATTYTAEGRQEHCDHARTASDLLTYIHEPDGAIIRAGLVSHLAHEAHGLLLDPTIAYFSSDLQQVSAQEGHGLTHAYRLLDTLPYNVKALRSYLRERKVGRVTIKKRGIGVTPEQLRPQLSLKGDNEATIILTRVNDKKMALIVEPV
ncbi:THUMP-like domain-containing protein [Timonella sp. A28]|uniref:THUMP-like domain-containing protein n=1 Tax=Timonella sp. A28 TaxID=3442640 RepID=UPI003EB9AE76